MGNWGHWVADSFDSFQNEILRTLVVEVELNNGVTGFGVSIGGDAGCAVVEQHLHRFVEGQDMAIQIRPSIVLEYLNTRDAVILAVWRIPYCAHFPFHTVKEQMVLPVGQLVVLQSVVVEIL